MSILFSKFPMRKRIQYGDLTLERIPIVYLTLVSGEVKELEVQKLEVGYAMPRIPNSYRLCIFDVKIPDGVTTIGNVFSYCRSLVSVTLPKSVKVIDSYAFKHCESLASVTLPEGVKVIGENAFSCCGSLVSVTLPESITTIGASAFEWCSSLASVTIPAGVTTIRDRAFCDCWSLTSVTIPKEVTTIERSSFCDCWSLTSVTIPAGVTTIRDRAFDECWSLESVTIPIGVTSIGRDRSFFHKTDVLVRMSWSLENFKRCDKASRERVLTILLCLRRKGIPYAVLRRFLNFLDLTRVLEI